MKRIALLIFMVFTLGGNGQTIENNKLFNLPKTRLYTDSRPWTRWWWFASVIEKPSVIANLKWLKQNGFGGVEIAWVYPLNRMKKDTVHYTPRQEWLSKY